MIDYNDIYEYDSSSYYYGYQSQSSITGYDAEGQITSAIEYVTMDADELPVIYQITGHNETEIGSNFQSVVSKANANLKSLELFNEEKCRRMQQPLSLIPRLLISTRKMHRR